jgi:hypothetical protein
LLEALAIDFSWNVGVFVGIGAIIVLIRGGKIERMPSEREIDAELARIRGEGPAGPNQPEAGPSGHFRESSASDARMSLAAYGARLRSLSKRDALRWVFAGLAVALVSWWAGTDHHLENLAYSLNVLEDFASWFTDNGIGFLVGGGVALYGGYRFITAPHDSEKQDAPS